MVRSSATVGARSAPASVDSTVASASTAGAEPPAPAGADAVGRGGPPPPHRPAAGGRRAHLAGPGLLGGHVGGGAERARRVAAGGARRHGDAEVGEPRPGGVVVLE